MRTTGSILLLIILCTSCRKKLLLFTEQNPQATGIQFSNEVVENDRLNFFTYQYFYNGAGVAAGDIDNDGWEDVFFVSNRQGGNKLYRNKTGFKFEDITATAGISGKSQWSTGVTMADVNADGWLDIYISTVTISGLLQSQNELYINNKDGSFTEEAARYGLAYKGHTTQAAFFDYDNDGDLDCFLLNHSAAYAGDYKTAALRNTMDSLSGEKLLENRNNYFTDVTKQAGLISSSLSYGLGVSVSDINNDGWMDIYCSNDFKENDYCYVNNGNGTFTERSSELFGHNSRFSMGNDMADINNDAWPEIISLDMLAQNEKVLRSSVADDEIGTFNFKQHLGFNYQFSKNCLQQNVDGKYFTDASLQKGVAATDWSWAPLLADFDNDGNKDLFISNGYRYRANDLDFNIFAQQKAAGLSLQNKKPTVTDLVKLMPEGKVADFFYLQQQDRFTDASSAAGFTAPTLSNGAVYADIDKDGRLDLLINRMNQPAGIYRNNMMQAGYCSIVLQGGGGNTFGIGAALFIYTKNGMQALQQSPVRGYMSSVSPIMHVGLGNQKNIDSLKIIWPGGRGQMLTNIAAGSSIVLQQKNAGTGVQRPLLKKSISEQWQNHTAAAKINFLHREDAFEDLNVNPLMPHSIASQGPGLAVGDVNNDGAEDFFVCGAKGQAGQLWLQKKQQLFIASPQNCFLADSLKEEVNAVFFDADADGDLDLYAVSGGNEWYGNNELLGDRLYINDGKGNFAASKTLPVLLENKSCVVPCDFDKDGDTDLFVGGRANARMYGYTPASVLLVNDGKGNFAEATQKISEGLQYTGMVTCACWSDVDGDGWQDLIVAGEWMPVTIFKNDKGFFKKQAQQGIAESNGFWNCMYKTDLDNDGDDDFLLGNWGTNSKLTATGAHPLQLYLADWDSNGDMDPVLCTYKEHDYFSFFGKSDLERRLPFLKKQYLTYTELAGKNVSEIFGLRAVENAKKLSAFNLKSSIVWNENGRLSMQALPDFLQLAPIFCFSSFTGKGGQKQCIAAGNFFDVQPFEGRYDALLPTLFSVHKKQVSNDGVILQKASFRNIQPIKIQNKTGLLLAENNGALQLICQQ